MIIIKQEKQLKEWEIYLTSLARNLDEHKTFLKAKEEEIIRHRAEAVDLRDQLQESKSIITSQENCIPFVTLIFSLSLSLSHVPRPSLTQ